MGSVVTAPESVEAGCGLPLRGVLLWVLGMQAPNSKWLASVWNWSCVLGSHSEVIGPRNSHFSFFVDFFISLFSCRCSCLRPWVSAVR